MKRWARGETVVVRNIARSDGGVSAAIAAIAIADDDDALALFLPSGTVAKDNYVVAAADRAAAVGAAPPSRERTYIERVWQVPTIRLYLPEQSFSVWLFFGKDGAFASWYGNLEAPFQRTAIGVDTRDHALDVVADARGRWAWKDEAEFTRRLAAGLDTAGHQDRVRDAGREFISRLENSRPPFNRGWQDWRAPANWLPRTLPDGWDADLGTHALLT